jgi:hypothetical protein
MKGPENFGGDADTIQVLGNIVTVRIANEHNSQSFGGILEGMANAGYLIGPDFQRNRQAWKQRTRPDRQNGQMGWEQFRG